MAVYVLTYDSDTKGDFDILDGDSSKVEAVEDGFEWHEGGDFALHPDGLLVDRRIVAIAQGVQMHPTHLPTKLRWNGQGSINDYEYTWNTPIVSHKVRSIIERFEPDRHQFEPVAFLRRDGSLIAEYYWFFPLTRLDSMDRAKTTHELINDGRVWKFVPGKEFVVSLAKVKGHYVWRDPRVGGGYVFISQMLKDAMVKANVSGTRFLPYATE